MHRRVTPPSRCSRLVRRYADARRDDKSGNRHEKFLPAHHQYLFPATNTRELDQAERMFCKPARFALCAIPWWIEVYRAAR